MQHAIKPGDEEPRLTQAVVPNLLRADVFAVGFEVEVSTEVEPHKGEPNPAALT